MTDFSALRASCSGPVLTPGDAGFSEEVASWRLNVTNTPDAVVGAASDSDVVATIRFARETGLPVAVEATGHGSAPITSGILIMTRRLDTIEVDAEAGTATIGAGAKWGAVIRAAAAHGYATTPGSGASVGVVGFLSGGGLGPLARSHGFSADHVIAYSVVTGEGELVEVSAESHPELFWAHRGGKFGLGIVISVTISLIRLPEFYGGSLVFDAPDIGAALRAWAKYTTTAHADVTTSVMLLRAPDLDVVPPPLRGRTLLMVRFAAPVDEQTGVELAAPLRGAAPVYIDQLAPLAPVDIGLIHNDPTDPSPSWTFGGMLDTFPDELVTALLDLLGPDQQSPLVAAEFRHVGSATATDVAGGTAVGGRDSRYAFNFVGAPDPALFGTVLPGIGARVLSILSPYESAVENINFAERWDGATPAATWSTDTASRLDRIRATYDPDGVFRTAEAVTAEAG